MNKPDLPNFILGIQQTRRNNHIPDYIYLAMLKDQIIELAYQYEYHPDDILKLVNTLNQPLFQLHDKILNKYLKDLHG